MKYPWGHTRRFNSYSEYIRKLFGGRVQKLTIDAGFSCPNRDGTKGTGGCTFCLNDAFNPSYCHPDKPVSQQIEEGIAFHEKRYRRATQYLVYFQAYTNTHAPVETLQNIYRQALDSRGIIGLVIGTRPDCVDDDKLALLQELSQKHHIMVEYGIESVYNKTLRRVNRCHTFEETADAIYRTAKRGLPAGGHMVFGLPGESREEMLQSAGMISKLPLTSIKFHQLQLFKGTAMADEYLTNPGVFKVFEMEEYLEFIIEYIELLDPQIVIERIAGETPPRYALIRPWGPRYDQILAKFEKMLEEKDSWQGKRYGNYEL
ncbi:MAG: TIGR01212 family radical SAM protein [Bacteroidales bacterium]|nr:TIGR01212 family radical SAM protein [Bacteroidales bacterium]